MEKASEKINNCKPTQFVEIHKNLLKGYSFKFEGLEPDIEEGYKKVVKDVGAAVADDAAFILVEEQYYNQEENKNRKNLYHIGYICDALQERKALDITPYNFYYHTSHCVICPQKCLDLKEENTSNINNKSNISSDNISPQTKTIDKEEMKTKFTNVEESLENMEMTLENENEENKIKNIEKKNDTNEVPENSLKINETTSIEKDIAHEKSDLSNSSESESESELQISHKKIKKDNIPSKENSRLKKSIKPKFSTPTKTRNKWIDPKRSYELYNKNQNNTSSDSDSVFSTSDDEEIIVTGEKWWINKDIPSKQLCDVPSCSFEPNPHKKHLPSDRVMSLIEKRIVLKYLIQEDCINQARSLKIPREMHNKGYLTHRSQETIRNCIRRTILPNIKTFGLSHEILNKFSSVCR